MAMFWWVFSTIKTMRVWNRTLDKTTPLVDAGATAYPTAAEAVTGADVVITALFGP
ncbi:MAG: NAD(P)-binding domain-containing protein, partial [Corynebacterium matruchotii]